MASRTTDGSRRVPGLRGRPASPGGHGPGAAGPIARARAAASRAAAAERDSVPVHSGVRVAADYAWRLLVLGVTVYAALTVLGRFQFIAVAVFVGLVVTSVLRPVADLLARRLPRALAVVIALVAALLLLAGLLALIANVVAQEWGTLAREFGGGISRIQHWLQGPPFHVSATTVSGLGGRIGSFVSAHRATLISTAVNSAGRLVEVATGAALALFCSVFFIHSGDRMWNWFRRQLPAGAHSPLERGGRAAWRTFAGYTRGIVIVAASNAALVGIALFVLGVPLALPLTVLEFVATFVPLIGSPIAMVIAAVVALAAKGPVTAVVVLGLIVVIGQIEGHLLHPLVMSWAVRLHPVVVAVSVLAGTTVAGVVGAVVAVPAVSVAWAVFTELRTVPVAAPP